MGEGLQPHRKLKLLSLFAGIGGFELGLERSGGFETVAQCEIDPFCNKVLEKHWPNVRRYHDIRDLTAARLATDGIAVDAICGGFPCQDISTAGRGAGIEGERSGLWSEYARLIGELRPRVVFVENVAALLGRGLDRVLGDLASLRYDAVWDCIPASAIGAPHIRDRLWITAFPQHTDTDSTGSYRAIQHKRDVESGNEQGRQSGSVGEVLANSQSQRRGEAGQDSQRSAQRASGCGDVPDANSLNAQGLISCRADTQDRGVQGKRSVGSQGFVDGRGWPVEPNVGRVAHGVPDRAHRLKALGNAVVPQIPELLGRAYLSAIGEAA